MKRIDKAMIQAMCGAKSIEKRSSQELLGSLSLEETLYGPARASRGRWYGHILGMEIMCCEQPWILKWLEEESIGNRR